MIKKKCPECKGTGEVQKYGVWHEDTDCPRCKGTGYITKPTVKRAYIQLGQFMGGVKREARDE